MSGEWSNALRLRPFQPVWSCPAKLYFILVFRETFHHVLACVINLQQIG
jgi:hypothetical protein